MANAKHVRKSILELIKKSETGTVEFPSTEALKSAVGATGVRTPLFQQILAGMLHQNALRGFSLGSGKAYLRGDVSARQKPPVQSA